MTTPQMSDDFAGAFRTALTDHVAAAARPRRHRWLLGSGITALALVAGTATAAATGLLPLPGATEVTAVSTTATGSFTGTAALDLGAAPRDATGVVVSLHCLTPGRFFFEGGAGLVCSDSDFAAAGALPGFDSHLLPLSSAVDGALRVEATPDAEWTIRASYASAETTSWATNDSGQSYGVINENGDPDLIAVITDSGGTGYVRRDDLEDADGTTAQRSFTTPEDALEWQEQNQGITRTIPVYDSEGTTPVGTFTVG